MMPVPRKYPMELCERAVRMYRTAEPKPLIPRMAEELGVHHEALRDWIRQAKAEAGERNGMLTTEEKDELAHLRCEVRELRRASEVPDGLGFFRGPARPDPAHVTALLDAHPHLGVEAILQELPFIGACAQASVPYTCDAASNCRAHSFSCGLASEALPEANGGWGSYSTASWIALAVSSSAMTDAR